MLKGERGPYRDGMDPLARFRDRLSPATYEDDVMTGVHDGDPRGGVWVPERLFLRLVHLADAYDLHVTSRLGVGTVVLSRPLARSFLDEVAFVGERVDDPALLPWLQRIADYGEHVLRRRGDVRLTVDPHP